MYRKKECVAMLLAGGQGSRLYALTDFTAKPAVTYGAKYRIIDFPLSNCINSGIDTVGVLTQYQPLYLNEYIGNGGPWDLDRNFGGVTVLPPYQAKTGADWYRGTANAIYQNLNYIERYNPDYVLILSGDHIYKMDYSKMLEYHKQKDAACTIGVIDVSYDEASRFGILSADENGRIFKFEEKPKNPQSTKASMGIYIFRTDVLFEYLKTDDEASGSSNDFGKDIIPAMLRCGEKLYAYEFEGYWKDVGTIKSLWEANMDLLCDDNKLCLYEPGWKIRSRNTSFAPQYISADAVVRNSIITQGAAVYGTVINSVISESVVVRRGAVIKDSVIMEGCVVEENAKVLCSIVDRDCVIGKECVVGCDRQGEKEISVVGKGSVLPDRTVVEEGEIVTQEKLLGGKN